MRRALSLALVLTLAAGIFTGCGGSASSQGGQAAATPEPTATPEPYEANALTGEAKDADYPEGQRITAVMVNNITDARPQRGLSDAKMLFEIKVEGGITRFMALFNSFGYLVHVGVAFADVHIVTDTDYVCHEGDHVGCFTNSFTVSNLRFAFVQILNFQTQQIAGRSEGETGTCGVVT